VTAFPVWLESTAIGVWARESPSLWAYPMILTLHTIGLGVLVGANAIVDLRLLGFAPRLPLPSLSPLYRFMWAGFALNAVTGILLFVANATTKATQPVFYVKLSLIAAALIVTAAIRNAVDRERSGAHPPAAIRSAGRLAVVSLVLWTGAIAAGRLMAYL
jgi:hypothetical protein